MARLVRSFTLLGILCLMAPASRMAAASNASGTGAVTLSVLAQGDTVRAYSAALYDRLGVRVDSIVGTGALVRFAAIPTEVNGQIQARTPNGYWLGQNYPNPFNPSTRIRFQIPSSGTVTLQIYDILGSIVASSTGELRAGIHEFEWSGGGAAGVYFYRVTAGQFSETKKMIKIDGGLSGASMLRDVGASSALSSSSEQQASGRLEPALRKVDANGYTIRLYDLLQTDPQIIDTTITLSTLTQDTVLTATVSAAPRSVIIPMPVSMSMQSGFFVIKSTTVIAFDATSPDLEPIGHFLADRLHRATGFTLPVTAATDVIAAPGTILLTRAGADSSRLGTEGYSLTIAADHVTLAAAAPAGIFYGVQTIRQLLPPAIEDSIAHPSIVWKMQTGQIDDHPRFAWRGVMQDVARHFFGLADLKRLVDFYSYYKLNHLHLHLADDTWSIEIKSWPDLAPKGRSAAAKASYGSSYLTQAEYSELCAYAQSRFITIVPEIDLPGHFSGALAAYPQLNAGGSYWTTPMFFALLDDVFRELSMITPGRYIHIGGDEAYNIPLSGYRAAVDSAFAFLHKYGKLADGWEEISQGHLLPGSIVQHWNYPVDSVSTPNAIRQGAKAVISRANKLYLDQKYNKSTVLGLSWAGYIEVADAYMWDPASMLPSMKESDIVGVESPLWSETTATLTDVEYLAFPRVVGHAEIGWSPMTGRSWDEYKFRLGYHGLRLAAMGINFYHSQQVPWR